MFHHISNARLLESLSDMSNEMSSLISRVEQAAKKFTSILKNKGRDRNSVSKNKKNAKKNNKQQMREKITKI